MSNFILIFVGLAAGFLLRRFEVLPKNAHLSLNTFVIYLSLPALTLTVLPPLIASHPPLYSLVVPILMPWMQLILVLALVKNFAKCLSRPTQGALILTAGLGNTSFVGFPLLEALIGPQALPTAILIDQAGSFLALATLGLWIAAAHSPQQNKINLFTRVARFPPFLALLASLLLPIGVLTPHLPWLTKLGATLVPSALVSVGTQLSIEGANLRRRLAPLTFGLGFKLVLAPSLFFVYILLTARSEINSVTLLESAMAPMITAAIVATEFRLDEELASLMVGVGIPLSLLTVSAWSWVISLF